MTDRSEPRGITRLELAARKRPRDVVVLVVAVLGFDILAASGPRFWSLPFFFMALLFVTMPLVRLATARWRHNHSSEEDLRGVTAAARRALLASFGMVGLGVWLRTHPWHLPLAGVVEVILSIWWLLSAIETIAIERPAMRLPAGANARATTKHLGRRFLVAICGGLGIVPAIITNTSGIAVGALTTKYVIEWPLDRGAEDQAMPPVEGEVNTAPPLPGSGADEPAAPSTGTLTPSSVIPPVPSGTPPTTIADPDQLRAGDDDIDLVPRGPACSATLWPSGGGPPRVLDPLVLTQITILAGALGEMFEVTRWSETDERWMVSMVVRFIGRLEESTITYNRKEGVLRSTSPMQPASTPTTAATTSTTTTSNTSTTSTTSTTLERATTTSTTMSLTTGPWAPNLTVAPTSAPTTSTTTVPRTTTTTSSPGVVYLEPPLAPASCDTIRATLAPLAESVTTRPR